MPSRPLESPRIDPSLGNIVATFLAKRPRLFSDIPGIVKLAKSRVAQVRGDDRQLAALGWTGDDAKWIALICLRSGVFTPSQYGFYFQTGADRTPACRSDRTLLDRGVAAEDDLAIFPGRAGRAHHVAITHALSL